MTDATTLRLIILLLGGLLLLAMYFLGRPKAPKQGSRTVQAPQPDTQRKEPTLGAFDQPEPVPPLTLEPEGGGGSAPVKDGRPAAEWQPLSSPVSFDRIVALTVAARPGEQITGSELVVAAEKIGLQYGERQVFHRLLEGRSHGEPVFSMANGVKPGHFDLSAINQLRTPSLSFFMTVPGPLPALDAWDIMLPAAQRMAELLDAQLLDAHHNALGRQTIQHIRDELRAYDRAQEKNTIKRR